MIRKAKIGDLFSVRKGRKMTEVYAWGELEASCYRYLQIEDLRDDSNPKYCEATENAVLVNPDDIVIAWDGANAGISSFGLEGAIGSTLARLSPKNESFFTPYVGAFVKYNESYLRDTCTGATIPHIHRQSLEGLVVPLPDISMQRNIARILNKAQELIDKRKQQIEMLDEFLQSVFLDMFGDPAINPKNWPIKGFPHFAKIDTVMTRDFKKYGELPHIGIENIQRDTGRLIDYQTAKDSGITSGKYIFTSEHIIYSKIRPNLNKVALPDFAGLCSADAYPLLVNTNHTNREFFAFMLRSRYFLDYISRFSSRTNIPKTNKKQLKSFSCMCPPLRFQREFSNILYQVEYQKSLIRDSLIQMENAFNSIMQRAFKGELFS